MAYHKAVSELMDFSINSYYVWKKENRPVIQLLQKYFSEDDINEFLQTQSISRLDNVIIPKNLIYEEYYRFVKDLNHEEILVFLKIVYSNQNLLVSLNNNFIEVIVNFNCKNSIKIKLIDAYTKITDKNRVLHLGLKVLLNEEFKGLYYHTLFESYPKLFEHMQAQIQIFKSIVPKTKIEYLYDTTNINANTIHKYGNESYLNSKEFELKYEQYLTKILYE